MKIHSTGEMNSLIITCNLEIIIYSLETSILNTTLVYCRSLLIERFYIEKAFCVCIYIINISLCIYTSVCIHLISDFISVK